MAVMVGAGLVVPVVVASVIEAAKPAAAAKAAELAAAAEELAKSLEPTVTNATSYKSGSDEVEHKGYIIALIANAVAESEGDATWKANALSVRDAALSLAKAKSQPNAEKAYKELQGLFGGGKGGEGKPMKYLDVASLEHVMKEVNERDKQLNRNIKGTAFARNKAKIAQDAQVWALLAAVAREDKSTSEKMKKPQADFEKHSDAFFAGAKSLAAAAAKGDQPAATEARKTTKAACTNCHSDFRITE
jgi:cytochrome c556